MFKPCVFKPDVRKSGEFEPNVFKICALESDEFKPGLMCFILVCFRLDA